MFHILGFLLFFILIILIIGFALLAKIARSIFGFGRKMTNHTTTSETQSQNSAYSEDSQNQPRASQKKKKIFDKDEGEYVDFEEINE